jgi:VWFA-related protein
MCRIWRCTGIAGFLLLILCCSFLFPQSKDAKKRASQKDQPSYAVKVRSVVINATVMDKAGNPVTDLTSSEFRVYDEGKPQKIQTFAQESFGPPEAEEAKSADASCKRTSEQKTVRPRLISIVIDDLTMDTALGVNTYLEFPRMADAVRKFVKNDVGPMDQVSILSGSRRVQFPFSSDKQRLLEEVAAVLPKLNPDTPLRPCNLITDFEAFQMGSGGLEQSPYFRQLAKACWDELEGGSDSGSTPRTTVDDLNLTMTPSYDGYLWVAALKTKSSGEYRARNLLNTVLQNIRTLRHFEGTKTIVLFSDGFISQQGTPAAYQMQELINMALSSGIVLNTISTRSISTGALFRNAEKNGRSVTSEQQWKDSMREDNIRAQHSPLIQMAGETGGIFSTGNDMYKPLQAVAHRRMSYYVLTYAMHPYGADGAYHQIKLEVTRPGVTLSCRRGYYTPTEELSFESNKREDIVDALNAPGNMNEIPITLSYNYSQEDDSTYAVSFITNVNIRGLQFPQEDDRRKNQISIVLAAFDENDHYISGLEKALDFQLLESSYAGLKERGLTSRVELKLPMGIYKIKAVVRENVQGKMGSVAKSVEIP